MLQWIRRLLGIKKKQKHFDPGPVFRACHPVPKKFIYEVASEETITPRRDLKEEFRIWKENVARVDLLDERLRRSHLSAVA